MRRSVIGVAALVAACGGSTGPSGPGQTPRLALVASVPVPNGTTDRATPLSFTFSVPVTWKELQLVSCVKGCRSPLVPYQFTSTGTQVVGTPILPPDLGATYTVRVTPFRGTDQEQNIDFNFNTAPATVAITSDITKDGALAAGVTYSFDPAVRIRAKLTIPPGADVSGDLVTADAGSIEAIGLPGAHILLSNGRITGPARLSYVDAMANVAVDVTGDIDHSRIYCTRLLPGTPTGVRISGSLTDSRVSSCRMATVGTLVVGGLTGMIARNVLLKDDLALGGNDGAPWDASTQFVNNFVAPGDPDTYGDSSGQLTFQVSTGEVRGNSFVRFVAGYFTPLEGSSTADLSGNWWSTTDMTTIGSYFAPFNDNGTPRSASPVVTPILTAADPLTPTG